MCASCFPPSMSTWETADPFEKKTYIPWLFTVQLEINYFKVRLVLNITIRNNYHRYLIKGITNVIQNLYR